MCQTLSEFLTNNETQPPFKSNNSNVVNAISQQKVNILILCCPLQRCHCQSLVLSAVWLVAGADQWLVESHWDGQYSGNCGHLWFWGWFPTLNRIGQNNYPAILFFVVWNMTWQFLCVPLAAGSGGEQLWAALYQLCQWAAAALCHQGSDFSGAGQQAVWTGKTCRMSTLWNTDQMCTFDFSQSIRWVIILKSTQREHRPLPSRSFPFPFI